jgi:hypothetical protein
MNKNLIVALAAVVLVLSLWGCGPQALISASPQSLIVGKWEMSGAQVGGVDDENAAAAGKAIKMSAEFDKDGTARVTMMGRTMQGTYKVSENELEWTMSGVTTKSKLNVSANELDLTDDANRTIKYKRK